MVDYSQLIITNKGQALIAKMMAGSGNIEFTKVCTSATQYNQSQLVGLTALSGVTQTSLISKVSRTNNVAIKVETAFSNADRTVGYYMRTLGLYAVDPDEGEILYAVTIAESDNCYMPPYNGITVTGAYIQLVTTVGNSSSVSLEVDPGAYATIGDIAELEAEIADLKAFVGYTEGDIYGVEVDFVNKKFTRLAGAVNRTHGEGFDEIQAFGGRRRCNVTNGGVVVAYQGDAAFTTTGKLTVAVDLNPDDVETPDTNLQFAVGTIVQTMVEQPKFYYKTVPLMVEKGVKGFKLRKARYYVSDTMKSGFKLHPAFIEDGNKNDMIYLSAFEGSLYDTSASAYILDDAQVADFANDLLSSIANAKPISGLTQSLTRANTRAIAQERGNGWEQSYAATVACSQMLMLVEYASFNMQSKIGNGVTGKTDDGTTSMTELTGGSVTLGNASGAVVNDNGYTVVSYRGEENLWGNIWTWVDGMNENNPSVFAAGDVGTMYIADHGFTDNSKISPYEDTGIHPMYGEGYISAFGYSEKFDWLFIAAEITGDSSLPVGDYTWNKYTGWRVARLGGGWHVSSSAGAFDLILDDDSSTRGRGVGGRLVYVPSKNVA